MPPSKTGKRSRAERQAAEKSGRRAETKAAWRLRLAGFRILGRRLRYPGGGEIDLVARRGRLLVFVEVKARATVDEALRSIDPRQQARIIRGAEAFLMAHPACAACQTRFDAIAVPPGLGSWPIWLRDAWRPN